jgi:Mg-chelatase subunit ChlD
MSAIPLADATLLRPAAQRTLIVRVLLAAILTAAIVAAVIVARNPNAQTIVDLPSDSTAIIALDLSASISSDTYSQIGGTLSSLAQSRGRFGLIVFSDQAYQALPPGTAAANLEPLVRYFALPKKTAPGFAPMYPKNPWTDKFSGGTKIAAGLTLAHTLALQNSTRRPVVILISDLDDDPDDLARLRRILIAFKRDGIPLRLVSLDASPAAIAFVREYAGKKTPVVQAGALAPGPLPRNRTPIPWALIALGVVAAVGLAANELWAPRLEWAEA